MEMYQILSRASHAGGLEMEQPGFQSAHMEGWRHRLRLAWSATGVAPYSPPPAGLS